MKNKVKTTTNNTDDLLYHLIRIIEQNDERFSFEFASGGECPVMEIYDKKKGIGYAVKIEQIQYDKDGNALNL